MSRQDGKDTGDQRRAARLAEQLRANLARRKAQARARRDGSADLRPDGIDTGGEAPAGEPSPEDTAGKGIAD